MIIQNYKELATNFRKKRALDILEEGLQAAQPEKFLKNIV